MPDSIQHASLVVCVLDLFHLDDLRLFQHLDGIEPVVVFRLHQMDATEAAGPQGALESEVIQRVLALGGAGIRPYDLGLVPLLALGSAGVQLRGVYQVLYAGDILARVGLAGGLVLGHSLLH